MIIILLITYFCILCVLTISCKEIPFRPSHNHSHKKHITWISFMIATCVYHAWRLLVDNAYHFLRYIRGEILYCRTVFVQCQSSMRLYFDTPSNIISSLLLPFYSFSYCVFVFKVNQCLRALAMKVSTQILHSFFVIFSQEFHQNFRHNRVFIIIRVVWNPFES